MTLTADLSARMDLPIGTMMFHFQRPCESAVVKLTKFDADGVDEMMN
jgi:hypothetical protein